MMKEEDKVKGVMQDWQVNIAKEGDVLHFVTIKNPNGSMWNPYYSTRVFEQDDILFCQMPSLPGNPYNVMPINLVYEEWRDNGAWDQGVWICIVREDEKDPLNTFNEEEFFKFFFRMEMTNLN